jgi:UDP-N-acetyl-D-glucosamine dehydrogenase
MEKAHLMSKVSIIGQGYVGLTIAAFAAEHHQVLGFDTNSKIVDQLNSGISHIEGVSSAAIATAIKLGNYRATTIGSDLTGSDVVVIAVPTPLTKERLPDLTFIEAACKTIAENLTSSALIINESTSYPGTIRNFINPLIETLSPHQLEHHYSISPERVDPGRTDWNQRNTPRLYSGLTAEASSKTREFYSTFCENLIEVSSPEVAEAAKLFENTFRQVNIALVNEFAQITNALGISVHETLEAADTKPYGFMKFNPSAGVGGHCIPVDPSYLAFAAGEKGVPATFIEHANKVNLDMPKYIVSRVKLDNRGSLNGKKVQVIGVSYKPDIADVRETPAKLVIEELVREGAVVTWHDPVVKTWGSEISSPLGGSEISIVVTLHSEFNSNEISSSAPYVFDSTGKLLGVRGL